ncbi:hypothetical protein [Roseivivax marinus]|uniref:hypothetical protein n=1 Tax=Roseivivax marinus TaxID=1379903 RepID=UPI00273CFA90|nr:hypothetical protein [Roseivivax marinus]
MPLFRLCIGLLAAMVTLPGAALALCDGAEALPDRVIALVDRRTEPDPAAGRIATLAGPTLARLGLTPLYIDAAAPLPDALDMTRIAGVLSWFDGPVPRPDVLAEWMNANEAACGAALPTLVLGDAGGPALWQRLGTDGRRATILHDGAARSLTVQVRWLGADAPLSVPPGPVDAPRLPPGATPLATLRGPDGLPRALGFETGTRTWVSDRIVRAADGRGAVLWLADPDSLFSRLAPAGPHPVPDLSVAQGRRIGLAILDPDGWTRRGVATGLSSLGPPAHDLAADWAAAANGAPLTFAWPAPGALQADGPAGSAAQEAAGTLSALPGVRTLPLSEGGWLGDPDAPRLRVGGPATTPWDAPPRLDALEVRPLAGPPGFADPTGLHTRAATVTDTAAPTPVAPDVLLVRASDLLTFPGRSGATSGLAQTTGPERTPMDATSYAEWLETTRETRILPDGPLRWRVTRLGGPGTLRIDDAGALALDVADSTGVLGARRFGASLFLALDPASTKAVISLAESRDSAAARFTPGDISLIEARPRLSDLRRTACAVVGTISGSAPGATRWSIAGEAPRARIDGAPVPMERDEDGWRVDVPDSRAAPVTLEIDAGCAE